jgi:hypothetical protein
MAGDIVIGAEGLGKKYLVGYTAERECYVLLACPIVIPR